MKKLSKKIFITVLTSMMLLTFFLPKKVNATNENYAELKSLPENTTDDKFDDENHIMMYDAKTGETTKVDMNQIRKNLTTSFDNNVYSLPSYTPLQISRKQNSLLPMAENASITKVYPTTYPYNKAFRLNFITDDGKTGTGSGAFVAMRAGLTAAHCVFNDAKKPYSNWICYAGYSAKTWWGTPTGWEKVYYDERYFSDFSAEYDWAILELQADSPVGWFGVSSYNSSANLIGMDINLLGYPKDAPYGYDGEYEYMISSTIGVWPNLNEVTFKGFGAYGFSGGPVYNVSNENIVAVFARSNYENCFGPRITANMMQIIGNYRE